MKKSLLVVQAVLMLAFAFNAFAHCQIPCGIYDDEARIERLLEDVLTIRKAVRAINKISGAEEKDYNQLVRWVTNKEMHAEHIQQVALKYFLAQRIKEEMHDYEKKLVALHRIIVMAMKAKQNSEEKVVDELEKAVKDFRKLYIGETD